MAEKKKATAAKPLPTHHGGSPDVEQLDCTPMEMPLGFAKPTPIHELIARAVRQEIDQQGEDQHETWEEADDFEEEDPDVLDFSAYEFEHLQDELPASMEEPDPENAAPVLDLTESPDPPDPSESPEEPQE